MLTLAHTPKLSATLSLMLTQNHRLKLGDALSPMLTLAHTPKLSATLSLMLTQNHRLKLGDALSPMLTHADAPKLSDAFSLMLTPAPAHSRRRLRSVRTPQEHFGSSGFDTII